MATKETYNRVFFFSPEKSKNTEEVLLDLSDLYILDMGKYTLGQVSNRPTLQLQLEIAWMSSCVKLPKQQSDCSLLSDRDLLGVVFPNHLLLDGPRYILSVRFKNKFVPHMLQLIQFISWIHFSS